MSVSILPGCGEAAAAQQTKNQKTCREQDSFPNIYQPHQINPKRQNYLGLSYYFYFFIFTSKTFSKTVGVFHNFKWKFLILFILG